MHDQNKIEPLEGTPIFADGRGSRHPVEGTVARGMLEEDRHLHEGRFGADDDGSEGELVDTFPMPVTRDLVVRGRERYDIFCAPCHARTGEGDGMIVRRGFKRPPSLHTDVLRKAKVGYLFDVITKGLGVMPAYAVQVPAGDRWAIVSYILALQRSHAATIDDVPADRKKELSRERGGAP